MLRNLIRSLSILALLGAALAPAFASESTGIEPNESWEWDVDHIERLLPRWETPEERAAWGDREIPPSTERSPSPPGIRNVAEFDPMTGVLIRYPLGIPVQPDPRVRRGRHRPLSSSLRATTTARTTTFRATTSR